MLNIKLDSPGGTIEFQLDEEDCLSMYHIARHVMRNMILTEYTNGSKAVMSYLQSYAEDEWERLCKERGQWPP